MAGKTTITGGAKLELYLQRLMANIGHPVSVRVGFLEGATYPDRSKERLREIYRKRDLKLNDKAFKGKSKGNAVSVALVAAMNEFGSPSRGVPPRPFFRTMIAEKKEIWVDDIRELLLHNEYNVKQTMALMGEAISSDLRNSIRDFTTPPLKQSTIDAKGFPKPLIDTAHMLHSIDYEVK